MNAENYYQGVKEILHLTPQSVSRCDQCDELYNNFEENVNHYLDKHGYKLLYAGQQTILDENANLCHDPFVLLGR